MLAVDLDGTLLSEGKIDPRDIAALHRARDAGIEVVIATGRSWVESQHVLEQLKFDGVMVSSGGAMLHELNTGQTLHRFHLDPDVIRSISGMILNEGHVVNLLQDSYVSGFDYWMIGTSELNPATKWWFEEHGLNARYVDSLEDVDMFEHTVRVGTVAEGSQLKEVAHRIQQELNDHVCIQHWPAVVESKETGDEIHLLEVFASNVDKWTMLSHIALERGVESQEIAAIGDGLNDIGMLRGAGIGIVMAGAKPNVQAAADWTTGAWGGGVAEAVEQLLRSR